jgi:hypothetical protein
VVAAVALTIAPPWAEATPQLAAQTKFPCGQCHVSSGGGGKLKPFGPLTLQGSSLRVTSCLIDGEARRSVAVATPIEQVVEAHLHQLDVSVALGESVAGEE